MTLGTGRVQPCEYFRPTAQPISSIAAINRYTHAIVSLFFQGHGNQNRGRDGAEIAEEAGPVDAAVVEGERVKLAQYKDTLTGIDNALSKLK